MAACKGAIAILVVALVATNVWWAFQVLDAGISLTYLKASHDDNASALAQVIAIAPALARCDASKEEIVAIAQRTAGEVEPFEKDGFVWVGSIGLRFGADGRFQEISRGWDPP